jgi:hypothetical protein
MHAGTRGEDSSAGSEMEHSSSDSLSLYEESVPVPPASAHTNAHAGSQVSENDHEAGFLRPSIGSVSGLICNNFSVLIHLQKRTLVTLNSGYTPTRTYRLLNPMASSMPPS